MKHQGAGKGIRTISGICAVILTTAFLAAAIPPAAVQAAATAVTVATVQTTTPSSASVQTTKASGQTAKPTASPTKAAATPKPTSQATAPTAATTAKPTSQPAATTAANGGQPTPGVTYPQALIIEHSAASAIVIETGRGRVLYAKDAKARLDIPTASKVMTALLAIEKQALDAKVTISNAVADIAYFETTGDNIRLRTGDKYSLEYLLLRMLFYDSDAAALAIAESVGNDETEFVRQMNARGAALGLKNTVFVTASGQALQTATSSGSGKVASTATPTVTPTAAAKASAGANVTPGAGIVTSPYTTVTDMATLMQRALQNDRFSRLFRKQSEYIVIDGRNLVPMANQGSRLWPYSEGRVNGAFLSGKEAVTTIAAGTIKGFGIVSITANGNPDLPVEDTLALYDACQRTYESSPLVQADEPYTGAQETTRDGETFGLVYQQTVNYVHPVGDLYLKTSAVYKSYGPYSRPIQSSMTVGQVVFELVDGTLIQVNVSPDRQILSSISLIDRLLNVLQANRNLYYLLISSLVLLLLILLGNLAIQGMRYYDKRRRS